MQNTLTDGREAAHRLNNGCFCQTVDHEALQRALESGTDLSYREIMATRPYLFSDTRVFVAQTHLDFMAALTRLVERIVALPAWQERVLSYAPSIARHNPGSAGVFLGYDFHLDADGPRLIEINTNAGGGLLNARLLDAQLSCCSEAEGRGAERHRVEEDFVRMFFAEWRLMRGEAPLRRIAIVDEAPMEQYLAPEFVLFRQLFEAHGLAALIVAPEDLAFDGNVLSHDGQAIDLVYNRLTDFALAGEQCAALRAAYLADAAVVTPHPRAHALYADKRNLCLLSDADWLQSIGLTDDERRLLLNGVPETREVTPANADTFWTTRKQWFFKPVAGFGSRGAYRGSKLTKRVFEDIAQGGFIAQAMVAPSERGVRIDGVEHRLKLDLRNFAYRDTVQLVSARLYQGQATNFRTRGGGFAAVFAVH